MINKISKKLKALKPVYKETRKYFLLSKIEEDPSCPVRSPWCTGMIEVVHHKKGRQHDQYADEHARLNDVPLLIDVRYFQECCNQCNLYFEQDPLWAKERGYSLSRLANEEGDKIYEKK